MSEIKKETATVETEKKERWYQRLWHNPKVRKGLKIVGGVTGAAASLGVGYLVGKNANGGCENCDESCENCETEAI